MTKDRFQPFELKSFKDIETQAPDAGKGILRMHRSLADQVGLRRNDLVKIVSRDAKGKKRTAFLVCRMSPRLKKGELALEYDVSVDLGFTSGTNAMVFLGKAKIWDIGRFLRGHPDPVVRYVHRNAFFLSLVSFVVGLGLREVANLLRAVL